MVSTSARQRKLFPLPLAPDSPKVSELGHIKLSKSQRRRIGCHCKIDDWFSSGLNSLNEISGAPYSDPGKVPRNAAQVEALELISQEYRRVPKPPTALSRAGAFSELCRTSSRYEPVPLDGSAVGATGARAPYDYDLVSWPATDSSPSPVIQSLDGADKYVMQQWRTLTLKSPTARDAYSKSQKRVKPYLDPMLVQNSATYCKFVQRLDAAGMIVWKQHIPSLLGCFFVRKKGGSLRIVLDTRDVNGFFLKAPHTRLPSPAAFGSIETTSEDPVYMSGSDLSNCFYHLEADPELAQWFSLPQIAVSTVPGLADRCGFAADSFAVPCLRVLPMGWSWSLHLAQKVHETRLKRLGADPDYRILDKVPAVPFTNTHTFMLLPMLIITSSCPMTRLRPLNLRRLFAMISIALASLRTSILIILSRLTSLGSDWMASGTRHA